MNNIFEKVAAKLEEDRAKAFKGLPPSSKYLSLGDSTDNKIIGKAFPQTYRIDLSIAHSISFHELHNRPLVFDKIEIYDGAKLTDNISTAAISAHAFILSNKALELFKRFELGNHKIYPAKVVHRGIEYAYGVLHFVNDLNHLIDFDISQFYIANIIGGYEEGIVITNRLDYETKREAVGKGEYPGTEQFWNLKLKQAKLKETSEKALDIFSIMSSSEGIYISKELAQAIIDAHLTGFEINRVYGIKD